MPGLHRVALGHEPAPLGRIHHHAVHFIARLVANRARLGAAILRRNGLRLFHPRALSRVLAVSRHIASTSKQARNGDIFIDVLPVEAAAAELDPFALGRSCVQQAWKPSQWDAQGAAIAQLDPHHVLVKSNCRRRNAHAMLSRSSPGVP
jgi:hypothetical protein